ncbi:hypothetical protein INT45_013900 [Circinella minor]|uniref:Uncharacterized protein n=1 Tax=Circinella minor TaxID=1195481 RepID=A0A8H7VAA3_9FUNG|nr:hypothetical protein INT45_013900 [Circinella minor]
MDDNFNGFTGRYGKNGAPVFNGNSTHWAEMGKMHTWIDAADSKLLYFQQLMDMQGGVIDTVNKRNANLEQQVHELKTQIDNSVKKKTRHSPRESILSCFIRNHYKNKMVPNGVVRNFEYAFDDEENLGVRTAIINYMKKASDDLGYGWPEELIEEKLIMKYHACKNICQQNYEALLIEFKDCDRLIDQELMSDEEDLHNESDEAKNFYNKLDELLHKSKKRITGMKRVRGDQYITEEELSKKPAALSVQPDNSEQHISLVQPEAPSEQ